MVNANDYSQKKDQYRKDTKANKQLQKAQNVANRRFQSKIALAGIKIKISHYYACRSCGREF